MFKLRGRKSACTTCAGSSEILRWVTPFLGPNMDPKMGSRIWITFSFLLLGLCLGPVLGSRFGPKSGVSHRRILLLPAEVVQADLRRTSMSVPGRPNKRLHFALVFKGPKLGPQHSESGASLGACLMSNTLLRRVVGIRPQTSASHIIATTSWQPGPRTREAPHRVSKKSADFRC